MKPLFTLILTLLALSACSRSPRIDAYLEQKPPLALELDSVVVPRNIAPLNYLLVDSLCAQRLDVLFIDGRDTLRAEGKNGDALPKIDEWHDLLRTVDSLKVIIRAETDGQWTQYEPITIGVASDIDPVLVYRLVEPGYEIWNEMGIYERDLTSFDESAIITNRRNDYGCINCHTFRQNQPDDMLLHLRVGRDGTYFRSGGVLRPSSARPPKPYATFVYPSWHPEGRFVAFSTNTTRQMFHTSSPNRIEVMDFASNIIVLDTQTDRIISSPLLSSPAAFETFPAFSPDGRTLYFCSADSVALPLGFASVRYSLCSIAFDAEQGAFDSRVDTLYNARLLGRSVSFPRPSPDGRHLVFTLSDYGNFSIWHREADLFLLDLPSQSIEPLAQLNSSDAESYHAWSTSGDWLVFSSRRLDGLYTRPFIAHVDSLGRASRPFVLPQQSIHFYSSQPKSYNIPELVASPVGTLRLP